MKSINIIRDFGKLSYSDQKQLLNQLKFTVSESKPILSHRKIRKESCMKYLTLTGKSKYSQYIHLYNLKPYKDNSIQKP